MATTVVGWKVVVVDTVDGKEFGIDEMYADDDDYQILSARPLTQEAAEEHCRMLARVLGRAVYDGRDPASARA